MAVGDSQTRLQCGNRGYPWKKPGPTRDARRHHCWGMCEERGGTAIGASFPVRALKQEDTTCTSFWDGREPPLLFWAPEVGTGCCHH